MTKTLDYELTLTRDKDNVTIMATHSLFHVIHQMEKTSILIYGKDRSKLVPLKKRATKIGFDYYSVEEKFFMWRYSKEKSLTFDPDETKIFIELWHIGFKQADKQKYDSGQDRNSMTQFYNDLLINLVRTHKDKFIGRHVKSKA